MKFTETGLPGALLIEPEVHTDARGFFYESWRRDEFARAGIRAEFVQDNHSLSAKGALRGLHYQLPPAAQAKLVRVTRGAAFDVVVDIRRGSRTFGRHEAVTLSAANRLMLFVPEGFAHGFLALEEGTELLYKVSAPYSREHDRGILWNDAKLGIRWPEPSPKLSEKDAALPPFEKAVVFP